MDKHAVVLFSGGLDSTTVLALARRDGYTPHALTFRYGQRHLFEVTAATRLAQRLGVDHRVAHVDQGLFGGSALTCDIPVPQDRRGAEIGVGIPVTYVPARNTLFLAYALAWAETLGARDVFIGANALDYSGYPDCRPEYLAAFEAMANLATKAGVEGHRLTVHAPLLAMTKAAIVRWGAELGVPFGSTSSCYQPTLDGVACGRCDACHLRLKGFAEAGLVDPAPYAVRSVS